jgi:hypothetical protein
MHEDVEALAWLNRIRRHVAGTGAAWNLVSRLTNWKTSEIVERCQKDPGQFRYVLYNIGVKLGRKTI